MLNHIPHPVGAKVIDQRSLKDNHARINAKMATDDQYNPSRSGRQGG
jgi:hypothetical protein